MNKYTIAEEVVKEILDEGLADSTFRECHPEAYKDLLEYRADLEGSVVAVLEYYE